MFFCLIFPFLNYQAFLRNKYLYKLFLVVSIYRKITSIDFNLSVKLEKSQIFPKIYLNRIEIRVPVKNKAPIIHSQFAVSSEIPCFDQHLARSSHKGHQENKNNI